ncbi:MAG: hypothetical protein NC041_07070 [Bacteroides sp.]|nr:hypothetical protein [Prevotella sp.]MCM1407058.1 hypothetical protein [Treponema brennaborense]MCM1470210.1 hypothetical protein [Bacteroides sp.]
MSRYSYLDIRNEAVCLIESAFAKHKKVKVEAHAGQFTEAEIRRLATKAPAILTSLMEIRDGGGTDNAECRFVSWVLCRASNADTLYDEGLKMTSLLIPVIRSIPAKSKYNATEVTDIAAENLYRGTLDQINISMWAVSWSWYNRAAQLDDGCIALGDELENFEGADGCAEMGSLSVEEKINMEN